MPRNDLEHFNWNEKAYREFQRKRESILVRDSFRCKICGMDELNHYYLYERGLDVHHIDGDPENNKKSNLLTVCCECHHKKHPDREWVRFYGLKYYKDSKFHSA